MVTGAGGFIGSHLTERLLSMGAEVRAVVRGRREVEEGLPRHAVGVVRGAVDDGLQHDVALEEARGGGGLVGLQHGGRHPAIHRYKQRYLSTFRRSST